MGEKFKKPPKQELPSECDFPIEPIGFIASTPSNVRRQLTFTAIVLFVTLFTLLESGLRVG